MKRARAAPVHVSDFGNIDWDRHGDSVGQVPFTIFRLDTQKNSWDASQQVMAAIVLH